jgi:type I restriction enzyme S subunit
MQLNQYSEASAQPGLSVNKIMRLFIAKPLFEEQNGISNCLISTDNKLQIEQTYLHKLQQIKAGLMADLLSGKKEVRVDEEPVS